MGQQQDGDYPGEQDKEILDILLESDLYLELPLRERQELFRHIVNAYLYSVPGKSGTC